MSGVKRYVTTCDCMREASWGDYVHQAAYAAVAAERDTLRKAVEALLSLDARGHQLRDRLQFSDKGRAILELCKP